MRPPAELIPVSRNRILTTLPREDYDALRPYQQTLRLPKGKVLYDSGDQIRHFYFPLDGMISLLSTTSGGATLEVGVVGNEGVVGVPALLGINKSPYKIMVQLPSVAARFPADAVREAARRSPRLEALLLRYIHTLITQLAQGAVCNRFHITEARLCRWLLLSRDRAGSDTLNLTQEFLSYMLGVPRTTVTAIAGNLQREGLIDYGRGRIQILDARRMEAAACECYQIVREDVELYLSA